MSGEETKVGQWHRDGNCIYQLQHAGWKKGVEQFRNRFSIWVQNDSGEMTPEELEAISRQVESLPGLLAACRSLVAHVRRKYAVPDGVPLECEHMRAIEAAITEL